MSSPGADYRPIDPKHHAMMNELAHVLDELLNGEGGAAASVKPVGFFLAVFDMDASSRFNYISNSSKLDVRAMLKEITARIEARLSAEGNA